MDFTMLHAFLGYGDFRNAQLLVLSKHEGANNEYLSQELDARDNHFGLDKKYWMDETDRLNGYWHFSTQDGGDIIDHLTDREKVGGPIPFVVNYPARILLALEDAFEHHHGKNIDKWFQPLGDDSYSKKITETFHDMYSDTRDGSWKAVLSHYQPLPRQNGTWPYPEFNRTTYENVFGKAEQPEDAFFVEMREKREEILVNLLKRYPKKLIFCTGNYHKGSRTDAVRKFFEREFQAKFRAFGFSGNRKGLIGEFTYDGQKTTIVHTQGFAFGGGLSLDEIRKITKRVYRG